MSPSPVESRDGVTWRGLLLAAVVLLPGSSWPASSAGAAQPRRETFELQPDVAYERRLTQATVHVYRAELGIGAWRVVVAQRGIDATLAMTPPDGRHLGPFNSPSGRRGTESLLVTIATPGTLEIEVRAGATASPGSYEILVEDVSGADSEGDRRRLAEAAMTEAARLYAQTTRESWRQALEQYREASLHWQVLDDAHGQARTRFALAALHARLGELRPALELYREALPKWRQVADLEGEATTLNRLGLIHDRLGESLKARDWLEQALELWQLLEDGSGEASTRNNLCLVLQRQGEWPAARTCYEETLALFHRLADANNQARVLSNLGGVHWNLGEPEPALELYEQALELHRSLGNRGDEAQVLNNLALLYVGLGEAEQAFLAYGRALDIFRSIGNRFWQARILSSLGYAYLGLGDLDRSQAFLEQALALRREVGDRRGEAITLRNLGRVHARRGEPRMALDAHRKALDLSRGVADRRGEATALQLMGEAHVELGAYPLALAVLGQAAALQKTIGDRRQEAAAILHMGKAHRASGDPESALEHLRRAEALYRAVRDPAGEMRTLAAVAQAERALGHIDRARTAATAALELVEGLRLRAGEASQRAAFLASQRGVYELSIDLLMELHADAPRSGHDREALEISERGRSRALLELVTAPGAGLEHGIDAGQRQRLRAAERQLTAQTRRQLAVLGRRHDEEKAAAVERDVHLALTELETTRAGIRRQSPRYAALTQPPPITAEAIRALLDPDTLLLEYVLGDERSFLWAVDPGSVASFELPGRRRIEELARRVYAELTTLDLRTRTTAEVAAVELARLVLGPVADRLTAERRLVVVADGALHYLPFAALPRPGTGAEYRPLVVDHEIVHLPSASVLAVQRRRIAARPSKTVAVLADPVFDASDPRAPATSSPAETAPAGEEPGLEGLGRLRSSAREAAAIAELVPAESRLVALGPDASRSRVIGGELAAYRFVHFATHGLIDHGNPVLSGLVLAQIDAEGRRQDGFLGLYDVYNLELGAELVVLSGCRTALGREVRGEGLVGLTRGFMYAGVPRVVASLWQVEDQATTELMARFYGAMLTDGRRPAAALRAAQLAIRDERRWNDRFYWAAFVFQGDWR